MNIIPLKRAQAALCALAVSLALLIVPVWVQAAAAQPESQTETLSEQAAEPGVVMLREEGPPNGSIELRLFEEAEQDFLPTQSYQVIRIVLEGEELEGDVPAFLLEERTLFPVRLVSEAMGAVVEWKEETRQVTVTMGRRQLVFTLGSPVVLVNGEEQLLPDGVGPCIAAAEEAERTMVPLRFLAESLRFQVEWEEESQTVYLTAPEETLPLSGFLVALDAGHGGWSSGAYYEEISEKDINLAVTMKTAEVLRELGCDIYLLREDDTFVDVYERGGMANDAGADILVSIHSNASDGYYPNFQGIYTYYYPNRQEGKALAKAIQGEVIQSTGAVDRGVLSDQLVVLGRSNMPAALVEIGFMTCHEELMRLVDPDYQDQLAQGIAQGIENYLLGQ